MLCQPRRGGKLDDEGDYKSSGGLNTSDPPTFIIQCFYLLYYVRLWHDLLNYNTIQSTGTLVVL